MTIYEIYGVSEEESLLFSQMTTDLAFADMTFGEIVKDAIRYAENLESKKSMYFMLQLGEAIGMRRLGVKKENYVL